MQNELMAFPQHQMVVHEGQFELVGFEELSQKVDELGAYLESIVVTPENVKENKKIVADCRKMCDSLNRERIDFKNQYLKPYRQLEGQVKEITQKVSSYEGLVREQIKALDEKERGEKEERLRELFEKRLRPYEPKGFFPFGDFLRPQHLNKSYPVSKVEEEMGQWLKQRSIDIGVLRDYARKAGRQDPEVLDYYFSCQNAAQTMNHFNELAKRESVLKASMEKEPKKAKRPKERWVALMVREGEFEKAKLLLELSGIKCRTE